MVSTTKLPTPTHTREPLTSICLRSWHSSLTKTSTYHPSHNDILPLSPIDPPWRQIIIINETILVGPSLQPNSPIFRPLLPLLKSFLWIFVQLQDHGDTRFNHTHCHLLPSLFLIILTSHLFPLSVKQIMSYCMMQARRETKSISR